jgi:hypothetical protein
MATSYNLSEFTCISRVKGFGSVGVADEVLTDAGAYRILDVSAWIYPDSPFLCNSPKADNTPFAPFLLFTL